MLWGVATWASSEELVNKSWLITALLYLNSIQGHVLKRKIPTSISFTTYIIVKFIVAVDTRLLIIADIKELNIRNIGAKKIS